MNCLVPKFRKVVHISNDTILIMDYRIWKYIGMFQIYVSVKLVNNSSDYGLAPNRPQAITCANDELVSTELWIKIRNFSVTLMHLKTSDMAIFLWCALEMIHVVRERLDSFFDEPTLPSETCSKSWKLQHVQQSFKSLFQQVSIMIKQFRLKIN